MRRASLGSLSPSQVNSLNSTEGSGTPRNGTKLSRKSGVQQQSPGGGAATSMSRTGRPSLGRRSSSMYGRGGQTLTETRPVGDRAFQQECIGTIVNYLTANDYEKPVSPKTLQTPSSKDVMSIIQFLFLRIDPNWEFRKIEEDVPLLFRRLGYPVQISRSALYAAGSPVSWPSLLAALSWLTNLLVAMEPAEEEEGTLNSPVDDQRSTLFAEYVDSSYYHFLKGEDDACDALDAAYVKRVLEENDRCISELEDLQAEANNLQDKVRKLRREPSSVAALGAKHRDYKDDIMKFNMVVSNFVGHKEAVERRLDEKRQELRVKQEEVVNNLMENEELRELVSSQQINAKDVEKMLKEKEILQVNLNSVASRKQELERTAWDHEINSSRKLRDLETVVSQFNDSCERLGRSHVEGLPGESQFDLKLQPREDTPTDILGGTVKTVVKPALKDILEKSRRVLTDQINPEALSLQEQIFRGEISKREKLSQISKTVELNKKLEGQCRAKGKEVVDVTAIVAERHELEERIIEEELTLQNEEAEIEYALRDIEGQFEATVKVCKEEVELERMAGAKVQKGILSAKEEIQETLTRAEEGAAQSIQNLLSSSQSF